MGSGQQARAREQREKDQRSGRDKLFDRPRQAGNGGAEESEIDRGSYMLARTRMEVFKSSYKRNKRHTKEMMLELGIDVDEESVKKGSGLFED